MFDTDRSGTIGFNEFWLVTGSLDDAVVAFIMSNFRRFSGLWGFLAAWRSLFDRFDTDQSGNISYAEFTNALAGTFSTTGPINRCPHINADLVKHLAIVSPHSSCSCFSGLMTEEVRTPRLNQLSSKVGMVCSLYLVKLTEYRPRCHLVRSVCAVMHLS